MERFIRYHWLALLATSLVGCGQPSGQPAGTDSANPPASAPATPATPTTEGTPATPDKSSAQTKAEAAPDKVVFQFLEAVRTGNDDQAASMLTQVARQKTAEENLVVAPPGSDTAKFEVGRVEMDKDGGACVEATWTDLDETGEPKSDRVLWMLRKEPEGWRIAGVAAPVFDGEPPLLLNFEDPEDMIRKQQQVREEIQRRIAAEAGQTVQEPATPVAQSAQPDVTPPTEQARQPEKMENPMRR